jgi:hypothetical protein
MNTENDLLAAVIAIVLFFAMLFAAIMYSETTKYDCRKAAIEKNMPAVEIITVCK